MPTRSAARHLAANPRTAVKATIRRASTRARREMDALDGDAMADLLRIYTAAAADIGDDIRAAARGGATVRLEVLQSLLGQVTERLRMLESARNQQLELRLVQAANIGAGAFTAVQVDVTAAAHSAVQFVQRFTAADGLQLSDRIWRVDRGARDAVTRAIESAVIQGHSASRAVEDFMARGERVPADLMGKIQRAAPEGMSSAARQALVSQDGAYGNIERVFRTELNRAHGEAYRASAFQVDGVVGTRFLLSPNHPRADICDMHASVNRYGLGPGVYPPGKSPWPAHPNTLSYEEAVFDDEVSAADRDSAEDRLAWLGKQDTATQELVLGGRAKRRALERGILRENEINTPWSVLQARYARRGVDVDALARPAASVPRARSGVRPEAAPGSVADGQAYVRERGQRTGHEYAYVVDTGTAEVLVRKTSNHPAQVRFSAAELAVFDDPTRRLDLVHNHPRSTPLSPADIEMTSRQGVRAVVAVGHDGAVYRGRLTGSVEQFRAATTVLHTAIYARLIGLIDARTLSRSAAEMVHQHLVLHALRRLGLVEYRVQQLGPGLAQATAELGPRQMRQLIDDLVTTAEDAGHG